MTLDGVFLQILNMSITGSYVILAILLVRMVLKKAPKIFSYVLWSVAAFRLLSPVSFPSIISLFSFKPFTMTATQTRVGQALVYVPTTIGQMQTPNITTGIESADRIINEALPMANATASANPMQIWTAVAAGVWVTGFLVLFIYGIISYTRVRRLASNAVRIEGNVFEADHIPTPFVLGFLKPRIFLPFHMLESERAYILRHERHHIRRGDHFIKPLSYLLLTVHWFNPLVWLSFHLMVQDMEMSCDELVLRQMGLALKRDYSESLLALATRQRFPVASPLAFGESNARLRVRNVLRLSRPRVWIMIASLLLSLVVLLACAANPVNSSLAALTQNLDRELSEKLDQIRQWGLKPETTVRQLESMTQTYLDKARPELRVGSSEFDRWVDSALSDGPDSLTGQAKTDMELGPVYLFLCLYDNFCNQSESVASQYPFPAETYDRTLEALLRDDIIRDFRDSERLNVLKAATAVQGSGTPLPTQIANSETEIASRLMSRVLDMPNEQIRLAIGSSDPANPSAAEQAMERAIVDLAGGQLSDSQVNRPGTSFRNQIVDFHTLAVIKGFTIEVTNVKFIPSASQKSLYAYEAAAVFSDEKESGKPITLIGRIQFDDSGRINFVSLEGSDYQAIWDRYAPRKA